MRKKNANVENEETIVSKVKTNIFIAVMVLGVLAIGCVAGVKVQNAREARAANEALLQATPLQNYNLWYGMDKYPKYKIEAANMVNELMAEGMSQEDACVEALNYMSDSVYEDTKNFIETENPEPDKYEELLEAHIKETQTIKY